MKNRKQTAEEIISDNGLKLLRTIRYDNIIPFVFENIRSSTLPSLFYFAQAIILFCLFIFHIVLTLVSANASFSQLLPYLLLGAASGSVLVIPVHELIHAAAYKFAGAPKIIFGMDLKQLVFYVAADRFLTGRKSFYMVALAPFLVINIITLTLMAMYPTPKLVSAEFSFLIFHNLMCIGDFALISFFRINREKELLTFDIVEEKLSYICERI